MSDNTGSDSKSAEAAKKAARLKEERKRRFETYWHLHAPPNESPLQKIRNLNKIGVHTRVEHIETPTGLYRYLVGRYVRGLICYQKYNKQDIQEFCRDRRLEFKQEDSRGRLIAALEKADLFQTFEKFMDLPPELRAVVYEHHFNWLAEMQPRRKLLDHTLPPPPITQICKLLRKEALPAFEDRRTIAFVAFYFRNLHGRAPSKKRYLPPVIRSDLFTSIRNIRLDLYYAHHKDSVSHAYETPRAGASCFITFSKDRKQVKVEVPEIFNLKNMTNPVGMWEKAKEKLQETIDAKIKESGIFTLCVEDLRLLPSARHAALKEVGMTD